MDCFARLIVKRFRIFVLLFFLLTGTAENVYSAVFHEIRPVIRAEKLALVSDIPGCRGLCNYFASSWLTDGSLAPDNQKSDEVPYKLRIEKDRYIIIALGGIILIILLLFIMIYRQWQLKYQQRILSLEQRLLRSQMSPHFIFNSLMNIQNFMLSNDVKKASNYLTRFARLIRAILDNSREEFIQLEEEIHMLRNYLDLQKLRHNNKLDYEITVDENIITEDILIPPMLTQPFVENAIEHGVMLKNGKGFVSVEICQNNDYLLILINDDGVGRKESMARRDEQKNSQRSLSTLITRERIDLYNSKAKRKIELKISDIKDEEQRNVLGTSVKLKIPLSKI
jgi:hypothetical protein